MPEKKQKLPIKEPQEEDDLKPEIPTKKNEAPTKVPGPSKKNWYMG